MMSLRLCTIIDFIPYFNLFHEIISFDVKDNAATFTVCKTSIHRCLLTSHYATYGEIKKHS